MIFLFPRWDMLIPWRVPIFFCDFKFILLSLPLISMARTFAQSLCSETRRLTCMTCLTWFIMPTFTNCSNQQKVEDRLHIDDFSSLWLWTCVPSTHLESIWTKFSRTCRGLWCIFDSSGGFISPQQNPSLPPKKIRSLFNGRRPWRVRNGKGRGFLGSLIRWVPRMSSPCGIIKESWMIFSWEWKLQQTNKTTWERICLFPLRQAQWTKKCHSFGGNDRQPAICKCEKKLQLLDVVLCCSQREDDFGWLLHLGSWSHVVQWFCFFWVRTITWRRNTTMQHRGIKLYEAKCCLGLWLIWLKTKSLQKAAKKVQDLELTLKKWKRNMLLLLIYFSDFFWTYLLTQKQPSILTKA